MKLPSLPGVGKWLSTAAALLALAACTGTRETVLPTLLVIGSVGTSGPQLQLAEDIYQPGATPPRDLVPVAGSETPLLAPPVSLDVVDRNGARSELIVLVSDADSGAAHLEFFDLTGLDPAAGQPLAPSRAPLDLASLLRAEATGGAPVCPVEVAVGGGGSVAAVLDDGSCRDGIPDIFVVDLDSREFRFALSESTGFELLAAGIFVEQRDDTLFFAAESLNRIDVHSLSLAGDGAATLVGDAELSATGGTANDLARQADGVGLLANESLALVPLAGGGGGTAESVRTLDDARMLLSDPTGTLEELVVIAATRVAIHADAEDDDPEEFRLTATPVDATLEPVQRFAYLLEPGGVEILDL
ncbi:MAG: hypothetical protein WD314_06955, partial [Trueperaceae bacterium]